MSSWTRLRECASVACNTRDQGFVSGHGFSHAGSRSRSLTARLKRRARTRTKSRLRRSAGSPVKTRRLQDSSAERPRLGALRPCWRVTSVHLHGTFGTPKTIQGARGNRSSARQRIRAGQRCASAKPDQSPPMIEFGANFRGWSATRKLGW